MHTQLDLSPYLLYRVGSKLYECNILYLDPQNHQARLIAFSTLIEKQISADLIIILVGKLRIQQGSYRNGQAYATSFF